MHSKVISLTGVLGLGLAITVAASLLPSVVMYLFARADWVANAFGRLDPPRLKDYFTAPELDGGFVSRRFCRGSDFPWCAAKTPY